MIWGLLNLFEDETSSGGLVLEIPSGDIEVNLVANTELTVEHGLGVDNLSSVRFYYDKDLDTVQEKEFTPDWWKDPADIKNKIIVKYPTDRNNVKVVVVGYSYS